MILHVLIISLGCCKYDITCTYHFFLTYLKEDCNREYGDISSSGQQLSLKRSGRNAPRAAKRKLVTLVACIMHLLCYAILVSSWC